MKNLSICLFVLGLSVVGCDKKPAAKPLPPMMPPNAAAHMAPPAAGATTDAPAADKKDDAPAADKKPE